MTDTDPSDYGDYSEPEDDEQIYKGTIYVIRNSINDAIYIGSTIQDVETRFGQHMRYSRSEEGQTKFCQAIRQIGEENFYPEPLDEISDISVADLQWVEDAYIQEYKRTHELYNAEADLSTKSEETREKMSKAKLGKTGSQSNSFKRGTIITHEHLQRFQFQYYKNGKRKTMSFSWSLDPRNKNKWDREEAYFYANKFRDSIFPPEPTQQQ